MADRRERITPEAGGRFSAYAAEGRYGETSPKLAGKPNERRRAGCR
jgi:hypothetical protein